MFEAAADKLAPRERRNSASFVRKTARACPLPLWERALSVLSFAKDAQRVRGRTGSSGDALVKHDFARHLRLHQTDVERLLWYALRNRELGRFKFRRQQPIGPYVVDFVCFHKKLILELDGDQHSLPERIAADAVRTRFLQSQGFRVKRFPNEILRDDFDAVLREIALALGLSEDALSKEMSPEPPSRPVAIGARAKWLYR
jgi:adenine-specific DNA-methyltransferase